MLYKKIIIKDYKSGFRARSDPGGLYGRGNFSKLTVP